MEMVPFDIYLADYRGKKMVKSRTLTLEQRVARLERLISNRATGKRLKNEDLKKLPNGVNANSVSDVLSGLTGVSRNDYRSAIRKLDRMGLLDAATNEWYPTADDVADGIADCWDDVIGNGRGAAQFYIGIFDGATRCSLTLYPISGGASRVRNITLKFNWPEEDYTLD